MFAGIADALSSVASILGVNSIAEATEKLIKKDYTPEQELELAKLKIQVQALDNDDRKSQREINSTVTNKRNFTFANVASFIIGFLLVTIGGYMGMHNESAKEFAGLLIALGSSMLYSVVYYWFGSSNGSAMKNQWRPSNE